MSDDQEEAPAEGSDDTAKAGRGGLAIAVAKLYFMVVGLAQQIALKHILGLQGYGALGRVQSIASVVYNPIVSTAVQGVSRAVSGAEPEHQDAATRSALKVHALGIVPVAAVFFLLAPTIGDTIRAPHLVPALRIVTGVLFFYGLYTPLVGVLNGRKRFGAQAAIDALFATMRTVGLLGGAYLFSKRGLGVEGALGGFVCAAGLILGVALPLAGVGKRGEGGPTAKEHLVFVAPLLGGQLALNLLLQSDLTLLGRFAADSAAAAGLAVTEADVLAGAYRNAQLFCFLPYQLLLAVTFVLFPLLASAERDGDREAVALYVQSGVRLAMILAGAMVSVTAGIPGALLNLVFGADSARIGAEAMTVLALGLGAFAIFGILATVLTSLKRERASALLTTVALALVVVLCAILVRGQPFGPGMLLRTAMATAAGLLLATILAGILVKRTAGAVVKPVTVVRVGVALAVAIGVARLLPEAGKLMTLVYSAAIGVVYALALLVTGELSRDDLRSVLRVAGR